MTIRRELLVLIMTYGEVTTRVPSWVTSRAPGDHHVQLDQQWNGCSRHDRETRVYSVPFACT